MASGRVAWQEAKLGAGVIDQAFVDTRKFSDYIFTTNSGGKDVVFKSLGYTAEDSMALAKLGRFKQQKNSLRENTRSAR